MPPSQRGSWGGFNIKSVSVPAPAARVAAPSTGENVGHSLRHIVGGRLDCFSCARVNKGAWDKVSVWNMDHKKWAWMSLFSVAIADIYIRLVANGIVSDPNTWSTPLRVIH